MERAGGRGVTDVKKEERERKKRGREGEAKRGGNGFLFPSSHFSFTQIASILGNVH